jgi:lysophospholipase L1-like esterase
MTSKSWWLTSFFRSLLGAAILTIAWAPTGIAQVPGTGVQFIGRWLTPNVAPTASYAGSTVLLSFAYSATIAADFKVFGPPWGQDLFISVSVDGGKPTRIGLRRGLDRRVVLASGLSSQPHVVAVRKEGEAKFGALEFDGATLASGGVWQALNDDRPIVEVIGDSFATGICALGPDSPETPASIYTSAWASEAHSWVGLLAADLAGVGHPVDMVDLAISGSTADSEADAYDLTAPGLSDAKFVAYPPPGHQHASVVFMWGGGNDHDGGGDLATGKPASAENLSPFEHGIYVQLTKILARNPGVHIVLLEYIDVTMPDWTPAYREVQSLFSAEQRRRMFLLAVHDPRKLADACEVDPKGHPNAAMHTAWAAQILTWLMSPGILDELGFPSGQQWYDEPTAGGHP